jgi:hypothetical protein
VKRLAVPITAVATAAAVLIAQQALGTSTEVRANKGVVKVHTNYSTGSAWTVTFLQWSEVPGTSMVVNVPAGQTGLLVARLNAVPSCDSPCDANKLVFRIPVDGQFAQPLTDDENLSGSMEKSLGPLPPGTHRVRVEAEERGGNCREGCTVRLVPWHLTIELARMT